MTATATHSPPVLSRLHLEALLARQAAVSPLLKNAHTRQERLELLLAVVAPSDPLLGLDSSTSSATERS